MFQPVANAKMAIEERLWLPVKPLSFSPAPVRRFPAQRIPRAKAFQKDAHVRKDLVV